MTITFESIGTKGEGVASATVTFPASIAANDLVLGHVTSKPFGAAPSFATLMPMASIASGSVANGNGTGSCMATCAARIATGVLTGTEVMTVASGSPTLGVMTRWSIAAGKQWAFHSSSGADTTETGTAVSATGTAFSVQPGDVISVTVAIKDDVPTHTSQTVTLAGATLSAMTWQTVITTTSGNDGAMYVGHCTVTAGTVTATPVYAATSSVSGASACGVAFLRLREQEPQLPGLMGLYGDPMVEPESHGHNPPIIDSNGNLYRGGESNLAHDTNRLVVQKSADGGKTWQAADWANHPSAQDLEAMWVVKDGTQILHFINRDDTVWCVPFRMSDHGTPDTYGTQETVDTGLSSTGVVQYVSAAKLSDGTIWVFYGDTLAGANNQIAYRMRTAPATYGSKATFDDGAGQNITGPACVVGASDVTYVVYKDNTGDTLYYRSLTAGGTLSAKTSIATGTAISSQTLAFCNPIYYDDDGVEVIGFAYINDSDILKYRELRGGVLQTEETISSAAVTRNPGATDSQSVVAHLAVDPATKRVYAMWSRSADGDLMMDTRMRGVGWTTEFPLWVSAGQTGWYVYCDIVTVGSRTKLIYTYDQGTHVDDASNITYSELFIDSPGGPPTPPLPPHLLLLLAARNQAMWVPSAPEPPIIWVGSSKGNSGAGTDTSFVTTWEEYTPVAGDIAVLTGHVSATSLTMSVSAGWDPIDGVTWPVNEGTNSRAYGWWRELTGGDTAPTITNSGALTGGWEIQVVRGATGIGAADTSTAAATTTINLPTLPGVLADSVLLSSVHARVASGTIPTGFDPPATYIESEDHATSRTTASANVCMEAARRTVPSAGSWGGDTFTVTNAISSSLIAIHVELQIAEGGATDHTIDQTDSAGLTDTTAFEIAQAQTDDAGLTDSSTVQLVKDVTETDSVGLTDTVEKTIAQAQTDSAGLTDSQGAQFSKDQTDSAGLTDTTTVELSKLITQTDDAGLTDSVAQAIAQAVTDSAGLTDVTAAEISTVRTDSAGLTDTADLVSARLVDQTDSAGLTDSLVQRVESVFADLTGLTDTFAQSFAAVHTDDAGLTDSAVVVIADIPPVNALSVASVTAGRTSAPAVAAGRTSSALVTAAASSAPAVSDG